MKMRFAVSAALLVAASCPWYASAGTFDFTFAGGGVSGMVALTYGSTGDSTYPQALEVTNITGTFTDTNLGISNATIGPLVPISPATPHDPGNIGVAPNDFSFYPVASGLAHGAISYDNLYWPGGSVPTAFDYPASGGFLDIYGLLFHINSGADVVNIWSNGTFVPGGPIDYGVAVVNADKSLDYVSGGVQITPEPGALAVPGIAVLGLLVWMRRRSLVKTV